MRKNLYAIDGVSVRDEDSFSSFSAQVCRSTYKCSPFVSVVDYSRGNFRGPRGYVLNTKDFPILRDCSTTTAPDSNGTKGILVDAVQSYYKAVRDVIAMTRSDITRWGGLGLVFTNVLETATLGKTGDPTNLAYRTMMTGLGAVARAEGFVVLNGESCQLGLGVFSENAKARVRFNWAGVMLGLYHPDKMILGDKLRPGQLIIALRERGFRCNGISSARKALALRFGKRWWENLKAKEAVKACAEPSVLYDRLLIDANGWQDNKALPISLIVHLSGGAFRTKLGEDMLFANGLSAVLDDLFEPAAIVRDCAKWRGMDEWQAYETWSCGQGMVVVIEEDHVQDFLNLASTYEVEAKVCGKIVKLPTPQVKITSKFKSGKEIVYKAA